MDTRTNHVISAEEASNIDAAMNRLRTYDRVHDRPGRQLVNLKRVGRNDPCPCNSGKKFKHCHLT